MASMAPSSSRSPSLFSSCSPSPPATPGKTTGLSALLFLLVVLQLALANIGFSGAALVGGLHGLNALLLVGLALWLVWRRWAF